MREIEAGTAWGLTPDVELTAAFMIAERETADLANPDNHQKGHCARLQAQFAF